MAPGVRVVVCDGHRLFAESVSRFLDGVDGVDVRATVVSADDAVRAVDASVDVLLLGPLPAEDPTAVEVMEALRNRNGLATRVVVMGGAVSAGFAADAIEAGAAGVCTKDLEPAALAALVRAVADGDTVLPDGLAVPVVHELQRRRGLRSRAAAALASLTPRERELMFALVDGQPLSRIAERTGLSAHTVRTHLRSGFRKLGVQSQLEAAAAMRRFAALGFGPADGPRAAPPSRVPARRPRHPGLALVVE